MRVIDADALVGNFGKWLDELKGECTRGQATEIENTLGTIEAIECCIAEIESAPTIEPELRHRNGCSYCKGRAYSKKPLTVITRTMKRVEVVFEYCPACGKKMNGG